jgi:hypothetical protein
MPAVRPFTERAQGAIINRGFAAFKLMKSLLRIFGMPGQEWSIPDGW